MKPTRQQIDDARAHFERLLRFGAFTADDKEHARNLLAATEPATEKELTTEAFEHAARSLPGRYPTLADFAAGYIAGARREGRR